MSKSFYFLLLSLCCFCSLGFAQRTITRQFVTIDMQPTESDWVYACGQEATFEVTIRKESFPLKKCCFYL